MRAGFLCLLCLVLLGRCSAQTNRVHGVWVWKGPSVLASPDEVEALRDFCRRESVNEVYVSVSERGQMMTEHNMSSLIAVMHEANIRVEALFSSDNADEGGKHLEKLLDRVRVVTLFNQKHAKQRFDGIHLDIEPQQRSENKGAGNLRFLAGLVDAYAGVRALADPAGLTVNADIQNKLLKGNLQQRRMLLSALPRFTLMMYEVSNPGDGDSLERKRTKVQAASQRFLDMAYDGLTDDPRLGKIVVGLRTLDYQQSLPNMLEVLDEANRASPRYLGWARHSYNDTLQNVQ